MSGTDRFDRLNAAELSALRLLAGGHSIKSAAAALGSTEAAVNERLREARRKTGFGSSRELARALTSQKNRDGEIGGAVPAGAEQVEASPRRFRGIAAIGGLTMILLLTAVAILSVQPEQAPAPPASGRADPLIADLMQHDNPSPPELYRRLRAEPRDARWADAAEATLTARYRTIVGTGAGDQLRVICGSRLCEVAGTLSGDTTAGERAVALQSETLSADLRAQGFETVLFTVGANALRSAPGADGERQTIAILGDRPGIATFIAYLERTDAS